jgi:hypothetical protein
VTPPATVGIVGAVASGAAGIIPLLTAATLGVGAFGALAIPTFAKIKDTLTQISTDQAAYNNALTKAAQSTAAKKLAQDWASLNGPQTAAVKGIQTLESSFGRLASKLAPDVFKVFNDGLRAANILLPFLLPLATASAGAIDGLVKRLAQFASSPGFKAFITQMSQLAGPAISAVGEGIGKIVIALGKLLIAMLNPNGMRALRDFFTVTAVALDKLTWLFVNGTPVMEKYFHNAAVATDAVRGAMKTLSLAVATTAQAILIGFKAMTDGVLGFIGATLHGAVDLIGWIPGIGDKVKAASKAFDGFKAGVDANLNGAIGTVGKWIAALNLNNSISARAARSIVADFAAQQASATKANGALASYDDTIRTQGVTSNAAHAARQALISDMTGAGVNAKTANTDVSRYTAAVRDNGVGSQQALQAREKLVSDIFAATVKAQQGRTDLANYTTAVRDNGAKSDAAKTARAKLITDLQNAGLSAQRANDLVNGLTTGINHIPSSKAVSIHVSGTGNWSISQSKNTNFGSGLLAGTKFAGAAGGIIPGYAPGVDSVLAAVSPGEGILVPEAVRAIGPANVLALNHMYAPGRKSTGMAFAAGGLVAGNFAGLAPWTQQQYDATVRAMTTQVGSAIANAINTAVSSARAAAQAATAGTGGFLGDSGVRSGSAALAQAFARSIMGQYGWGANQWPPWLYLGNQESGWSAYAVNASSGAYGIGQALGKGHPYNLGDYQNQVIWMANYIRGRYGNPAVAWQHEQAFNWYGNGGTILEPVAGVGLRTGRRYGFGENGPETVTPGLGGSSRQLDTIIAALNRLTEVTAQAPARTAAGVAAGVTAPANTAAQAARLGAR